MLSIQCPNCGKSYRVQDQLLGKNLKCGGCGGVISSNLAQVDSPTNEWNPPQAMPAAGGPPYAAPPGLQPGVGYGNSPAYGPQGGAPPHGMSPGAGWGGGQPGYGYSAPKPAVRLGRGQIALLIGAPIVLIVVVVVILKQFGALPKGEPALEAAKKLPGDPEIATQLVETHKFDKFSIRTPAGYQVTNTGGAWICKDANPGSTSTGTIAFSFGAMGPADVPPKTEDAFRNYANQLLVQASFQYPNGFGGQYLGRVEIGGMEFAMMNFEADSNGNIVMGDLFSNYIGDRKFTITNSRPLGSIDSADKIQREIIVSLRPE